MSAFTHAFQWSISFVQDLQFDFYCKQIQSKLVWKLGYKNQGIFAVESVTITNLIILLLFKH